MYIIFYLTVVIGSIIMLVWLYRGPFYVPTRRKYVQRIISMLDIKKGETFVDLGSGDGRLLVAIVEAGGIAHGYEHNPLLVMQSRKSLKKLGMEDRASVYMENFWNTDISKYDGVVVYGIPYIMNRLEEKLKKELKSGARVVSYSFPLPKWEPSAKEKAVYLYKK